jgi:hypothetical protein
MKVQDLFEAKRVATDKGYYTPGYDEEEKNIRGTVKDWMARLGATKEDIAAAVAQAKDLDSYAKLVSFDKSTGAEQKNGTFSFKKPNSDDRDETYLAYANGQIRSSSRSGGFNGDEAKHRPTRLKAPKPRLVAGDPIKSLVKIYDGAFKELALKMAKRVAGKPEQRLKEAKEISEWEFVMGVDEGSPRRTSGDAKTVMAKMIKVFKRDCALSGKEAVAKCKEMMPKLEAAADPKKLFSMMVKSDLAWDGYDLALNWDGKDQEWRPAATRY